MIIHDNLPIPFLKDFTAEIAPVNHDNFFTKEDELLTISSYDCNTSPKVEVLIGVSNFIKISLEFIETYPNLEVYNQTQLVNILHNPEILDYYKVIASEFKSRFMKKPVIRISSDTILVDFSNTSLERTHDNSHFRNYISKNVKCFMKFKRDFSHLIEDLEHILDTRKEQLSQIDIKYFNSTIQTIKDYYNDLLLEIDAWILGGCISTFETKHVKVLSNYYKIKELLIKIKLTLNYLQAKKVFNSLEVMQSTYCLDCSIRDIFVLETSKNFTEQNMFLENLNHKFHIKQQSELPEIFSLLDL